MYNVTNRTTSGLDRPLKTASALTTADNRSNIYRYADETDRTDTYETEK
jgi:hypothetical protein